MFKKRCFHYRGPENHCSPTLFICLWGTREGNLIFLICHFLYLILKRAGRTRQIVFIYVSLKLSPEEQCLLLHPNACHLPSRKGILKQDINNQIASNELQALAPKYPVFWLFWNACQVSFPVAWAAHEGLTALNKGGRAVPYEESCKRSLTSGTLEEITVCYIWSSKASPAYRENL